MKIEFKKYTCTVCGEERPAIHMNRASRNGTGRCKFCHLEANKTHRRNKLMDKKGVMYCGDCDNIFSKNKVGGYSIYGNPINAINKECPKCYSTNIGEL